MTLLAEPPAATEAGGCASVCPWAPTRPDRDDPALAWCLRCGACIGTPTSGHTPRQTDPPFGVPRPVVVRFPPRRLAWRNRWRQQ